MYWSSISVYVLFWRIFNINFIIHFVLTHVLKPCWQPILSSFCCRSSFEGFLTTILSTNISNWNGSGPQNWSIPFWTILDHKLWRCPCQISVSVTVIFSSNVYLISAKKMILIKHIWILHISRTTLYHSLRYRTCNEGFFTSMTSK